MQWFLLSDASEEFHDVDPKRSSFTSVSNPEIKKGTGSFFHGRYRKYSAQLGTATYILKVQEDDYPELPIVEYLCNQIADTLSMDVPPYYLINYNGRITFITRNFMQDYIGNLHHIYKFLSDGIENHNCEEIIKILQTQTGKLIDVKKFIEICLFDAFIGNNDRHGRNLGIIETATIKKLAPMYDNPSWIGVEDDSFLGAHLNPSGSIWTKNNKEPKAKDYINEFKRLGYEHEIIQFSKRLNSRFSKIQDLINESQLGQKRKDAFIKLLTERFEDFKSVI